MLSSVSGVEPHTVIVDFCVLARGGFGLGGGFVEHRARSCNATRFDSIYI